MPSIRRNERTATTLVEAAMRGSKTTKDDLDVAVSRFAELLSCHIPPSKITAARMVLGGDMTVEAYAASGY